MDISYVRRLGPTWLAGAIAAGPATMASLITAGASFGYGLFWVVVLSALLGALAQYLAARLGVFTADGIVSTVERRLGEGWAWLLVVDVVLAAGLAQLIIMKGLASISETITGLDARVWGALWAVVLAVGLAGGGYRVAEWGAKLLVSAVVLAFVVSLAVVPVDPVAAVGGLVPRLPGGLRSGVVAAGVLGGAVHVTLVTMQSYTQRAREWTGDDHRLAAVDVGASMLGAFGLYSVAIFLVAAGVLHGSVDPANVNELSAAQALGPLVGPAAKWLFLLGLWGAAVSTLGGNTTVPPFLLADKLGYGTTVEDDRYRALLVAVALLSAAGPFVQGGFFPLLVATLAFGLVGTPFAIALVLYLLNDGTVAEPTPAWLNAAGLLLLVAAVLVGWSALQGLVAGAGELLGAGVAAFAVVMGLATLRLGVRYVRA